MPRMNGLEFCREMRADSELQTVPILLISALQKDTESVVAGLRAGADDYLEIPFDSARLVAKVSRLLERSRLEASYRDLVEQASDMIFTQDLAGRLTSINLAGLNFLGRKQEEVIGNSFFSVFGIIPESNGFAGTLNRPEEAREFRHQFVARSAGGEDRWLDLIISPIKDKLDETLGLRGLARGVTQCAGNARSIIQLEVAVAEQPGGMLELHARRREPKRARLSVLLESSKNRQLLENATPTVVDHDDHERALRFTCDGQDAQIMHEADVAE
jgi:PAS domain S-box-containing protein